MFETTNPVGGKQVGKVVNKTGPTQVDVPSPGSVGSQFACTQTSYGVAGSKPETASEFAVRPGLLGNPVGDPPPTLVT